MSEWAEAHRYLSPESASEPGKWHNDRVPHFIEIMDVLTDDEYETVVVMSSSQVGKTEAGLNWIGWTIDHDPVPMLCVVPNLDDARTFSKIRLAPMLRDCPVLTGKVKDARGKKSNEDTVGLSNETTHKTFPGGHLTIVGSNSPSGLASKPICRVYVDELDRFELSAGDEGDQIQLVRRRMQTFWNRKLLITSTPGIKGVSRVEAYFNLSDRRYRYVPCPHCGEYQILKFGNLKWDKDPQTGDHLFNTVHFECVHCHGRITDDHRWEMIENGEWRKTNPVSNIAGFHIWAAYSPWVQWQWIAEEFIRCKRIGPEALKAFVNTVLGETWEEEGDIPDWEILLRRQEPTDLWVAPDKVLFVTVGIDVQPDRIEAAFWGWGAYEECWALGHEVIFGDPDLDDTWSQLDLLLAKGIPQPTKNATLHAVCGCVDTGHKTQAVYRYVRTRGGLYATKGASTASAPRIARPSYQDINWKGERIERGIKLYMLGTHVLKATIYSRLRINEVGPRYIHFPSGLHDEWFRQLTAERLVTRYNKNHQAKQEWVKVRHRNEILDCFVLAYAGALLVGMERIPWDKIDVPGARPHTSQAPVRSAQEAQALQAQQVSAAPPIVASRRFAPAGNLGRLLKK